MNIKQARPYLIAVGVIVALVILMIAFRQFSKSKEQFDQDRVKHVEATPVHVGKLLNRVNAIGKFVANQSVMLRTEMGGRIAKIQFQDGQQVNAGDPLIEFDKERMEIEYKYAKAKMGQTLHLFERSQELYNKKLISSSEFEKAKAEYEQAKAAADEKDLAVRRSVVRAPFEGVVGIREKDISIGAYIERNVDIVSLVDTDPMLVDFNISGAYVDCIKKGQIVSVSADGTRFTDIPAKIEAIDSKIEDTGNTLRVRASIPNSNNLLTAGMFVRVKVVVGENANAIQVPEAALETQGNQKTVFRIVDIKDKSGKAVLTPVTIGQRENAMVEIVKGLGPKDVVVTSGQTGLYDGMTVNIQNPL